MTEGSRFPTHLVWVYSLRLSQRSGLGCRENGGALSDRPGLGIEISNGEDCSDDHLYSWRESALAVARRGVGEAVPPATPAGMWTARRVISLPGASSQDLFRQKRILLRRTYSAGLRR